jgi:carbon-monoxide dehydrogenase medium subunit
MKPPDFAYARPTTIADAVSALAASGGEGKVLAGGQSLVPLLNFRLASPALLVDLNRITELSHVTLEGTVLRVGAMTRMRALETDPTVAQQFPLLAAAAHWVGHVQIRNRGTVGGSLAHADPAAEVPAVALLVDAELVATGPDGERRIPADEFFQGFLFTALAEDEILTEVRFPLPASGARWGFREFAHRRGDFALAGAAVLLPAVEAATASGTSADADGRADTTRIVVFGTSDRPRRSERAEAALVAAGDVQSAFADAARLAAEDAAADDPRPDAAYRRQIIETMVRRALEDAAREGTE